MRVLCQDRREVENKAKSGGQEEEEGKDKISLVSFLEVSITPNISFVLLSVAHRLTYHDDSPRLLCCAHTHDGCHTNGGALEIDPTKREKTDVITSST